MAEMGGTSRTEHASFGATANLKFIKNAPRTIELEQKLPITVKITRNTNKQK